MIDLATSRRTFRDPAKSTLALLMILFFPVVGSLFYFQLKRKLVNRRKRKFNPEFNPH
ncbi:PLD nuclease N-terminal domain-containing protein [Mesonia sp.]|uniref:PLD nuclease N-terminal domain-containing protein n=1 Tax=Mesonia sp. TaxID=1960830 RepID=UPI001773395A|nr:PLDc_N domain-containing protein [Mesonia sp.]HIO26903.1 PLDc_N domain-containing protein [Flavobacteriaceae bacterium]